MMIDFHTHTFFSDGALDVAEQIRRAEVQGYGILGIADHVSLASMERVIPIMVQAAAEENSLEYLKVLAGVELTHVRPEHIAKAANKARTLGAQVIIVHGETITEPVQPGTNRAAIEAGVDILAHPGLITLEDAQLAAKNNVMLEITAKFSHALTNGHVVNMAREAGAQLVFGSDAHEPSQFPTREFAETVCSGAGLTQMEIDAMFKNAEQFASHKFMQLDMDKNDDW